MSTNENLPPNVIKQLAKELKNLDETPPEGIKVGINNDDFSTIYADIEGPCYFMTKIFHPNIATNGEICVNTLKKDWNPSLGLRHVLLVVRCLLIEPFPESALNEQAGKMLLENYEEYSRHARLYTGIHAKPKPKLKQGAISESTTVLNVDPTNTSCENVDPAGPLPPPSPHTSSATAGKGASGIDESAVLAPSNENMVGGRVTVAPGSAPHKKEGGAVKAQVDKKKFDARKKSLKRL